ncbi:MAG: UTP--glucose-1-phosphate uridylyltransferase, partial [Patescibacteria group bacterium]
MQKIRKIIIPVAGLGTRFLPFTKAQPKEMLPIIDKPVVQFIVEEAITSGIEDIILVTNQNKRAIEDHFDSSIELERVLKETGKLEQLDEIRRISKLANFIYIRQKGPRGNGTPILNAKHLVKNESFAVVWGDDIYIGEEKPRIKQMIEVYEKYTDPVLGLKKTDNEGTKKYGIIDGQKIEKNVYQINKIVEKPGPQKAPSKLACVAGYIITPDIFDFLENIPLRNNELWLVDAIDKLIQKRSVYGCLIDAKYYDTGSKINWLKANIEFGLQHPEIKQELKKYLKSL